MTNEIYYYNENLDEFILNEIQPIAIAVERDEEDIYIQKLTITEISSAYFRLIEKLNPNNEQNIHFI